MSKLLNKEYFDKKRKLGSLIMINWHWLFPLNFVVFKQYYRWEKKFFYLFTCRCSFRLFGSLWLRSNPAEVSGPNPVTLLMILQTLNFVTSSLFSTTSHFQCYHYFCFCKFPQQCCCRFHVLLNNLNDIGLWRQFVSDYFQLGKLLC